MRVTVKPYWQTSDEETVKLYHGHVIDVLRSLPEKSAHMVVTSPPYFGLRDYGAGQERRWSDGWVGALGAEPTPQMFVAHTVAWMQEVKRVLRSDGTVWLNLGDTWASGEKGRHDAVQSRLYLGLGNSQRGLRQPSSGKSGLPPGNLVGIPWRCALALQDDGWVLRQDIIWHKPSPMPESVHNRCTKAHEYIFLLTKSNRYYYGAEAIKESGGGHKTGGAMNYHPTRGREYLSQNVEESYTLSNKRSVWTVSSQGYPGAHFATFPRRLVEPCIKAGTSEYGACSSCGSPWRRVIETKQLTRERPNDYVKRTGEDGTGNSCSNSVAGVETKTTGWEPTCYCFLDTDRRCRECGVSWKAEKAAAGKDWNAAKRRDGKEMESGNHSRGREDSDSLVSLSSSSPVERHQPCLCFSQEVVPCTVLDPFVGSGTTCCAAVSLGRRSVGIDLSEQYLAYHAIPRIEGELLGRKGLRHLVGIPQTVVSIGDRE